MPGRSMFAVTRSLARAKQRYPWAKAWVQVRSGVWCFESAQDARLYQPETPYNIIIIEDENEGPRQRPGRKR
jgi:hypothetical protein